MFARVDEKLNELLAGKKAKRRWLSLLLVLSLAVSSTTVAVLMEPSLALTNPLRTFCCPYAGHSHTDACYDENGCPVCAFAVAHTHGPACYDEEGELICTLPEKTGHVHSEECYADETEVICGLEETPGHVHTDDCYMSVRGDLICTDEDPEHEHTDACYAWTRELICGMEEGEGAHTHSADCYSHKSVLICGQTELPVHVHGADCFIYETPEESEAPEAILEPQGDPGADVETASIWERTFAQVKLTGNWAEDVLAIAETQIGYAESERNYVTENGVRKGYTRYGAWYGAPYYDWCALFISFCMHYAGVNKALMPQESGCGRWVRKLSELGLYRERGEGTLPEAGELVFFRYGETGVDHVGLVCYVDAEAGTFRTVEGNSDNRVQHVTYELTDKRVLCFASLPENPAHTTPAQSFLAETADVLVEVEAPEGAFPAGTEMVVTPIAAAEVESAVSETVLGSVTGVLAVDISFYDASGAHIEPALPIRVTLRPTEPRTDDCVLVHIDDEQNTSVVEQTTDETADETGGETAVIFDADAFSTYALVWVDIEQLYLDSDGSTWEIRVTYTSDAGLPADATLAVSELLPRTASYNAYLAQTLALTGTDEEMLTYAKLLDISIVGPDGAPCEPLTPVDVRIRLLDTDGAMQQPQVVHFGETPEILDATLHGDTLQFRTDGFSVYTVTDQTFFHTYKFYVPKDATQTTFEEYHIYTDIGDYTTFTQVIKNSSEGLVIPQLPAIPDTATSTFSGWYLDLGTGENIQSPTLSSAEFDFHNLPDVTSNDEFHLYARFANYAYVIFHEQYNGTTETWPITATRRGELTGTPPRTEVRVDDITVSYDDNQNEAGDEYAPPAMAFRGWTTEAGLNAEQNEALSTAPLVQSPLVIELTQGQSGANMSNTVELFPVFCQIYWLTLVSGPSGSGATYYAPFYKYSDETVESLTGYRPTRRGYTFGGWYADEGFTKQITNASGQYTTGTNLNSVEGLAWENGQLKLSKNVSLYAKWDPAPTDYTLLIWRQKVTDAWDLADANKTYDFAESVSLTGVTDEVTAVAQQYKNYGGTGDYYGFHFGRCDDAKALASNGSTVLNVYYDRNVRTFVFTKNSNYGTRTFYLETTSDSGNQYGYWNNQYQRVYYVNGVWRQSNNANGAVYTGTRYTQVTVSGTYTNGGNTANVGNQTEIHRIHALYGASIADIWTFRGSDNVNYPQTGNTKTSWTPKGSTTYTARITKMMIMPDENLVFIHSTTNRTARTFYYYVEALPDAENTRPYGNMNYVEYTRLDHDFNIIVYEDDFWQIEGFTRQAIATSGGSDVTSTIRNAGTSGSQWNNSWNSVLYFYYTRNSYDVYFMDSDDNSLLDTASVKFEAAIAPNVPPDPTPTKQGYTFNGWFADPACRNRVYFTEAEYNNSTAPNKTLFSDMPAHNQNVYAGWSTEWYLVKVDPNGGAYPLGGNYSTWFWKEHGNTEQVLEYEATSRDYVESLNGDWYYAVRDRDFYGLTDEWESREDDIANRKCYYTQDFTDPAIVDLNVKYKYVKDAYRYANWFELEFDDQGNVTGEHLYNFSTRIDHNMTIRLHWKQVGTYYIRYDPGTGTLDDADNNEDTFVYLDDADYTDHSDVVVTRIANPPEKMNFVGWTIRGGDGTVFHPGEAFEFQSKYAVMDGEKEVLILDAVYTRVSTSRIIYDANGGYVAEACNYGRPTSPDAPDPTYSRADDGSEIMISALVTNTEVQLSTGAGFSRDGATIVGWNTEPDGSGTHYDLFDPNNPVYYYVDNEEPVRLYAEWLIKVYFHRNQADATWTPTTAGFIQYADDVWYTEVLAGHTVTRPAPDPTYTGTDNLMFHYWGTERYAGSTAIDEYDFSQPVNDELHLYAYWAGPIQVPIHPIDASGADMVEVPSWRRTPVAEVTNVLLDVTDHPVYITDIPSRDQDWIYAFTAVHRVTAPLSTLTEADAVTALWFDSAENRVCVRYADPTRPDTLLDDEEELYFVYYRQRTLPIGYKVMEMNGDLGAVATANAPTQTGALGAYSVDGNLTTPLGYPSSETFGYYAYALGAADYAGLSAGDLQLITSASSSDAARPALQVKNTWRGLYYSTDGGTTWVPAGYDGQQLYVVYFRTSARPVMVTVNERTLGTAEDKEEQFPYRVIVEEYTKTTTQTITSRRSRYISNAQWQVYNTGSPSVTTGSSQVSDNELDPYLLSDGGVFTVPLFYDVNTSSQSREYNSGVYTYREETTTTIETWQSIRVEQTSDAAQKDKYDTENHSETGGTSTQPYVWEYEAASGADDQVVTYTNTRKEISLPVHIALSVAGTLQNRDDYERGANYTVTLTGIGASANLTPNDLPGIFTGDPNEYAYVGAFYGTEDENGVVSVVGPVNETDSVTFGELSESLYGMYLNGDTDLTISGETLNADFNVYFIYFRIPRICYVEEKDDGSLALIDPITANGNTLTMNGVTVAQRTELPVGLTPFRVAQSGDGSFRVPPELDGNKALSLAYTDLAVGPAFTAGMTGERFEAINHGKQAALKVEDGCVVWSFDGETWTPFQAEPVIYAVYREKGQTVTLKKVGVNNLTGAAAYPLSGAAFTVYLSDGTTVLVHGGAAQENVVSSVTDGVFFTGTLPLGIYYLVEAQAPAGYKALPGRIRLEVTESGVTMQGEWVSGDASLIPGTVTGNPDVGFTLAVRNTAGYELPATGGRGTVPLYFVGGLLAALALLLLIRRRQIVTNQ